MLYRGLLERGHYLDKGELMKTAMVSVSQLYAWLEEITERKRREPKWVSEEVASRTLALIRKFPHLSAAKGQAYMVYHRMGRIPQHIYKKLKQAFRQELSREVTRRELRATSTSYTHERAAKPNEIWGEDFTKVTAAGVTFPVAVVMDVASRAYLGATARTRATAALVEQPLLQALKENGGIGPQRFLISDNGSQYVGQAHGNLLAKHEIVHKRIPACRPEYNGSVECGIKEFKNVFYNLWADRPAGSDEGSLLEQVQAVVEQTRQVMNREIPRPCLAGVTAWDVHTGEAPAKREANLRYQAAEPPDPKPRPSPPQSRWRLARETLNEPPMSDLQLLTKYCFSRKRPLRLIAKMIPEVLGH